MANLDLGALREQPQQQPPLRDEQDVDLTENIVADPSKPNVVVEFPDGSVTVSFGSPKGPDLKNTKFDANLAMSLSDTQLASIAEDLLEGIEEDNRARQDWLDERAEGIKLLALKIEKPTSTSQGGGDGVDNTSRSRHTLLLEAVLRFQANASGELLPADGPVKVSAKMSNDTLDGDELASALEDDMNYYLTEVASEYYPDTERMLLWTGMGGSGFKKVYRCPIRQRPVSESVDAADLIVSNAATDLRNADRVTFVTRMRQSTMKRMQFLKVYRDVVLGQPTQEQKTAVDEQKEAVTGVTVSTRPEDTEFTVLECYCNIDVPGDEHKKGSEVTGLPRPYKVSIDKTSRTVLEIRRNWKKEDDLERPREIFVKFPYVPGMGFYDLGLIHIAGNMEVAATALLRIMIDNGIYANFPGGLVAKSETKQNTLDITVPPGGYAPIDTSMAANGDIRAVVMPMPYREFGQATFGLYEDIVKTGARVAGTAEIQVGEGNADAPVGTTIALIEQATKVMDAVHKRLHTAQSKEFQLIRNLFRETPEDFWRFNQDRDTNWDKEKLLKALNDYNLIPRADPNTSSQLQRVMRAQALYQMAKADPTLFQVSKVLTYVMTQIKINNPADFTQEAPPPSTQPDPKAQAALISAQAAQTGANAKLADVQLRAKDDTTENQNRDADRAADIQITKMKLDTEKVIHGSGLQADASSQLSKQNHERGLQAADLGSQTQGI